MSNITILHSAKYIFYHSILMLRIFLNKSNILFLKNNLLILYNYRCDLIYQIIFFILKI